MPDQIINAPYSVPLDPSTLIGVNEVVIRIKAPDEPFVTLDDSNELGTLYRTLGSSLTAVVSKAYQLYQQKTALLYTVVTDTTAETITYAVTVDLSSNYFNSGDTGVLSIPVYLVSGVSSLNLAARTVNITATDDAGTPVVFKNGGDVDVDAFDYILDNNSGLSTQDLTGYAEAIVVPLSALEASTTKRFTFQVKFNLPVAAKFVLYKSNVYRTQDECNYLGSTKVTVYNPQAFAVNGDNNVSEVKGVLGNILGIKQRISGGSFSFESDTYSNEDARKIMRNKKYTGGYEISNIVELTVPSSFPYELSSGIPRLNRVTDVDQINVRIREVDGTVKDTRVVDAGGEYLPSNTVRLYDTGATKKLRFSAADAGKTILVQTFTPNPDKVFSRMLALGKFVYADVTFVESDATDVNTALRKQALTYRNCTVSVSKVLGNLNDEQATRLKFDIRVLSQSADSVMYDEHYTE